MRTRCAERLDKPVIELPRYGRGRPQDPLSVEVAQGSAGR